MKIWQMEIYDPIVEGIRRKGRLKEMDRCTENEFFRARSTKKIIREIFDHVPWPFFIREGGSVNRNVSLT